MSRPTVLLYQPRGGTLNLPLSLLHVASMLPEFEVRLIDGRIELTPEAALAELAGSAVCLGVTVLTGKPIVEALRASRAVKRRNPALPVIWGGWHPSLLAAQCLASAAVDACVHGQGEETFREVVTALAQGGKPDGAAGISYRRGTEVVAGRPRPFADVNGFPAVDYGLIDLEKYFARRGARRLDYSSSQGLMKTTTPGEADPGPARAAAPCWSGLTAGRVVAEVRAQVQRHRIDQLAFSDDDFFADPSRATSIAEGLIDSGVDVRWFAAGRAEVLRHLTPEQLALIKLSGCQRISVGAESGWAGAARIAGTGASVEALTECAEKLNRAGIGGRFSFVAGFPLEPPSSLAETYRTVKILRKINGRFETPIHFYAPYPGTALSERLPSAGFEPPPRLEDWEGVDLEHFMGPWIPEAVRKFVPRYNFYLRAAFEPVESGLGKRIARWFARWRVRFDFYRFDFERRLVEFSRRLRTGGPLPAAALNPEN